MGLRIAVLCFCTWFLCLFLCLVPGPVLGVVLVVRVKSNPMQTTSDAAMPPALAASGPLSLVAAALLMVAIGVSGVSGVAAVLGVAQMALCR